MSKHVRRVFLLDAAIVVSYYKLVVRSFVNRFVIRHKILNYHQTNYNQNQTSTQASETKSFAGGRE